MVEVPLVRPTTVSTATKELFAETTQLQPTPSVVTMQYDPNDFLNEEIIEDSWQKHYPGSNYMGPGTHVYNNVKSQILPNSYMDAVALMHDINYLRYTGDSRIIDRADLLAIRDADDTFAGTTLKMGLAARTKLGLTFDSPLKGKTPEETNYIGWRLQDYVLRSPLYNQRFDELGFNPWKHVITNYDF